MKIHYLKLLLPQILTKNYLLKIIFFFKALYYGYIKGHKSDKVYHQNWKLININRQAIINSGIRKILSIKKNCNYLEIGCNLNQNFNSISLKEEFKTGVDPKIGGTIRDSSDNFFNRNNKNFDIIFIDGLHHYDQCQRDIKNSIKFINNFGIIFIHDLLPRNWKIEHVPRLNDNWTGDVWKVAFDLKNTQNLDFYIADVDSGVGCAFVSHKTVYNDKSDNMKEKNFNFFIENINTCRIVDPNSLIEIIDNYRFN